ncbi:MAG: sigma-70 family RNA polymerase sigma factor [Planctomycetota bacterium]
MSPQDGTEDDDHTRFLQLYTANQHRVLGYLLTLTGDRNVAEDLLQETAVTVFTKFSDFKPGTDFAAWACQVAYWKVMNHRRSVARSKTFLSDELLERLAERTVEIGPTLDARRKALDACLQRLDDRDRAFLMARYQPDGSVALAAQQAGRTTAATYKALTRLRQALRDCVSLQLAAE